MKALFGSILLGLGIIVAGLSGLCTVFFGVASGGDMVPLALLIGGIPCAVGIGMFFWGKALMKSAREDEARADDAKAPGDDAAGDEATSGDAPGDGEG